MIQLSADSDDLVWIAEKLAEKYGYAAVAPVIRSDLSLLESEIRFKAGPAVVTASITTDAVTLPNGTVAQGVKLTLRTIAVAGVSVSRIARPVVRHGLLKKLALLRGVVDSHETPDANILLSKPGVTVSQATIAGGRLSVSFQNL